MNPVKLILDTSAVRRYPHVNVGEPITQVEEDGGVFTIPLPCLAAAYDHDPDALRMLLGHELYEPVDLPYGQWRQYGAMLEVLGRHDTAAALLLATVHRCHILTAAPGLYGPLGDDPPVIEA